jgi:hypothetical protein
MPDEECPEKTTNCTREANKAYALTIGELSAQIGRFNESQYAKLNEAVDRARAAAFEARSQLQHHIQEHQC